MDLKMGPFFGLTKGIFIKVRKTDPFLGPFSGPENCPVFWSRFFDFRVPRATKPGQETGPFFVPRGPAWRRRAASIPPRAPTPNPQPTYLTIHTPSPQKTVFLKLENCKCTQMNEALAEILKTARKINIESAFELHVFRYHDGPAPPSARNSCSWFSLSVAKMVEIGPKIVVVSIRITQIKTA